MVAHSKIWQFRTRFAINRARKLTRFLTETKKKKKINKCLSGSSLSELKYVKQPPFFFSSFVCVDYISLHRFVFYFVLVNTNRASKTGQSVNWKKKTSKKNVETSEATRCLGPVRNTWDNSISVETKKKRTIFTHFFVSVCVF